MQLHSVVPPVIAADDNGYSSSPTLTIKVLFFLFFGAAEQYEPLEEDSGEEAESLSQTEEEAVIYTARSPKSIGLLGF